VFEIGEKETLLTMMERRERVRMRAFTRYSHARARRRIDIRRRCGILCDMIDVDQNTVEGVRQKLSAPMLDLMRNMNEALRRKDAEEQAVPDGSPDRHEPSDG
jgi:hypothetical protein